MLSSDKFSGSGLSCMSSSPSFDKPILSNACTAEQRKCVWSGTIVLVAAIGNIFCSWIVFSSIPFYHVIGTNIMYPCPLGGVMVRTDDYCEYGQLQSMSVILAQLCALLGTICYSLSHFRRAATSRLYLSSFLRYLVRCLSLCDNIWDGRSCININSSFSYLYSIAFCRCVRCLHLIRH